MKKWMWILSGVLVLALTAMGVMVYVLLNGSLCWHDFTEASCTEAQICKKCEQVRGVALGHDWLDSTCEAPQTCQKCGLTQGEKAEHEWLESTCELPMRCSTCEATRGEAKGHTWKSATCTEPKTCRVCNATKGSPMGHYALVKASCTEKETCARCKKLLKDALGHAWVAASCTEAKKCSRCEITEGSALGHSYKGVSCQRCYEDNPKFIVCSQVGDNIYYRILAIPNSAVAFTSIKWSVSGTTLTIELTGEKTFDIWGKNNNDPFRCIWKLYDARGYIVDAGEIKTEDLVKGDRFKKELVFKGIDTTQTYQLKFYDYEVLD